jgi:hypothetical protein
MTRTFTPAELAEIQSAERIVFSPQAIAEIQARLRREIQHDTLMSPHDMSHMHLGKLSPNTCSSLMSMLEI